MTTFLRRFHQFCVVFQGGWAVYFAYAYAEQPSVLRLFSFVWAVAFGAYSFHMLRAERNKGVKA